VTARASEPGYGEAMAELDAILTELEGDDLDVDVLAARVQRASELLQVVRARILRAQADVDRIVADLDTFDARGGEGGEGGEGDEPGDEG
jgi:exodeoxyribonuclease VII small subunit